ncbi:hypothetical protein NPIL_440781 [Nephila pilipes]|uniref:Spider venom protein n=1 Tax=Nephila pilipes TaxID=299642 RepID=A0A8X6NV85_NEPPI|nr:hypothetical protein NPIL_440781 [Nephila pilipes]
MKAALLLNILLLMVPVLETSSISSRSRTKIYALSNFQLPVATKMANFELVKSIPGRCPEGYIYDSKTNKCRWLICPDGSTKRDKICVEN